MNKRGDGGAGSILYLVIEKCVNEIDHAIYNERLAVGFVCRWRFNEHGFLWLGKCSDPKHLAVFLINYYDNV